MRRTMISLDFISDIVAFPIPLIPSKWIDRFMSVKLEANRV